MSKSEVISLKEFFTTLLDERDRQIYQRFEAMEKAVTKAEQAHEKRLESMNEFRGQLLDQSKTFIPRTEFELVAKEVEKIKNVKQGGNQAWLVLVAGVSLLIAFLTIIVKIMK